MNKKKQKKNDLRSSIILLLLLLLLLISATYAWFTANQTVKISSIDVHIEAQNGLQISTDAATWKSIIENVDITDNAYTGNKNQLPTSMEPVSTIGEVLADTGRMRMFYGTVDESTGTQKLSAIEETYEGPQNTTDKDAQQNLLDKGIRRYVAFDVFLKVDAVTNLQLGLGSNVMKTAVENVPGNEDRGIKQASRVAFCILANKPAGTAAANIINEVGGTTSYIWEPNANLHTLAAQTHASNNYGDDTVKIDGTNTALPYYGIKAAIPSNTPVTLVDQSATYFSQVTPAYSTYANAEANTIIELPSGDPVENGVDIFTLQPGITKVRMYMWIEGQDYDCENTASGTDISYNVQLQVKK